VSFTALLTGLVVAVNVALVLPEVTVTVPGMDTEPELSDKATTSPAGPAGPVRVTVPVELLPPITEAGENDRLATPGRIIVRVAVLVVPLRVAVMVTTVTVETPLVVMVNVPLVLPGEMYVVPGTLADPLEEDRVTRVPRNPEAPVNVTVPVALVPPTTVVGEMESPETPAVVRVSVPWAVLLPRVPVTVTVVVEYTPLLVTVKLADVWPAGMVTEDGTVASKVSELLRLTVRPPVGAGPERVAVPVELLPPATEAGEKVIVRSVGARTVSVAVLLEAPRVAVMVTVAFAATAEVVAVNVADVLPAVTVTLAGTLAAAVFELDRVTASPPEPAGPVRVTVPVEFVPPVTEVGAMTRLETPATVTVSVAVLFDAPSVAVRVADAFADTGLVVAVKFAVVAPAATVTVAGIVTSVVSEFASVTTSPVGPAAAARVTVPVELFPPMTDVGATTRLLTPGRLIVRVADCEDAPSVAVMSAVVVEETAVVVTVNVADVLPGVTVTLPGTVAAPLPELRDTTSPDEPAGPVRVTVPVELDPPTTDVGERETLATPGRLMVRVAVLEEAPRVAVIVEVAVAETALVEAVKVAVVFPEVTVTDAGTVAAAVLEEVRVTTSPLGPAFPLRVTVPVEVAPPTTAVGDIATLATPGTSTFNEAVFEEAPRVAVRVTVTFEETADELAVKVADALPARTVTVAGTVAAAVFELVSETTSPVGPAGPVRVTVPVEVLPPTTAMGRTAKLATPGRLMVRVAFCEEAPSVAVMTAEVVDETAVVVTVNVADVFPAVTVTEAGTVADPLPDPRVTTSPVGPAGPVRVTVPVELDPPTTEFGANATLATPGRLIVSVPV
jgi:hypothetical protein